MIMRDAPEVVRVVRAKESAGVVAEALGDLESIAAQVVEAMIMGSMNKIKSSDFSGKALLSLSKCTIRTGVKTSERFHPLGE